MAINPIINYDKEASSPVKKYLAQCERYLSQKFGEANPVWKSTFMLLSKNLDLYFALEAEIQKKGLVRSNGRPNPCLKTQLDVQLRIEQQIKVLGLSPYSQSLLRTNKSDDTQLELDFLMGNQVPMEDLRIAQ